MHGDLAKMKAHVSSVISSRTDRNTCYVRTKQLETLRTVIRNKSTYAKCEWPVIAKRHACLDAVEDLNEPLALDLSELTVSLSEM